MRQRIEEILKTRSVVATMQVGAKVGPMMLRGLFWKFWLKQTDGLILIGKQVTIRNPQYISVGDQFVAEDYSEIQGLSREGISIGEHVTIGRFAMIRPSGYYGREIGLGLQIGNYSNIGPYCFIGCSGKIVIGNNVLMGPNVTILAEEHKFKLTNVPIREQGVQRRITIIEDDCWLGSGSTILSGVRLGVGAIVAAGAVVAKDVTSFAIVGGVPAKIIGWRKPNNEESD